MIKQEYDIDPESVEQGDEIDSKLSFCGICFEPIYAPIIAGIWYHGSSKKSQAQYDHEPVIADTLTQLFLQYKLYGNGTLLKIGKYDDKDSLACPCYMKWFNLLKKDIEAGFYGEHYYDENGVTLCKVYLIDITSKPITDPEYPDKQGYLCKECIDVLKKKKIIKIVPPSGKRNSEAYNGMEWLKKK